MKRQSRTPRYRLLPLACTAILLAAVMVAGCSGNPRVSVGGSVHFGSGGAWGHGLSLGIQSHRVVR